MTDTPKTARFYATTSMDGQTPAKIVAALDAALADLAVKAEHAGREVLWGTIDFGVERRSIKVSKLTSEQETFAGPTLLTVTADCLRLDLS